MYDIEIPLEEFKSYENSVRVEIEDVDVDTHIGTWSYQTVDIFGKITVDADEFYAELEKYEVEEPEKNTFLFTCHFEMEGVTLNPIQQYGVNLKTKKIEFECETKGGY